VGLETVTVCTKSLQVFWVVVPTITVDVVNVELTDVYWLEVTLLAVVLLVDCIRV
jgi:hypothetical protein